MAHGKPEGKEYRSDVYRMRRWKERSGKSGVLMDKARREGGGREGWRTAGDGDVTRIRSLVGKVLQVECMKV